MGKGVYTVNRKFAITIVLLATILTGLNLYASLSPKTVTVHVEKLESSYQLERPLEIVLPKLDKQ